MKPLRIAVIGMGHLGTYHLQKYCLIEGCRIIGVVDTDPGKAHAAASGCGCEAFTDHRGLLGKVDAVSIAVPTVFHYEVARDFLAAGTDVLLEKPITTTLEQADELIRLADAGECIFQIGFVERFNPAITALASVIRNPVFIESHRLHPFFERGTDVDVLLDLMIHDLDILLHFVPSQVKSVEAVGVPVLSDKIDIANVRVTFENGCVANITASRVTAKTLQKIRFFGEEGYHAVDYSKRTLLSLKKTVGADGKLVIEDNNVTVVPQDPLEAEIRAFVDSVRTRTEPAVTGRDGRSALALALTIVEKIEIAHAAVIGSRPS